LSALNESSFFKEALKAMSIALPSKPAALVLAEAKMIREKMKNDICLQKMEGHKFSLSLKEVKVARREWLLISAHARRGKFFCFGLLELPPQQSIPSEMSSKVCLKLKEYGVLLSDLLCIIVQSSSSNPCWSVNLQIPRLNCLCR
jgi:hypothetical protein